MMNTLKDRKTLLETSAELDTLSEMLAGANDSAVTDEVRGRLANLVRALSPGEQADPFIPEEDPYMWVDPTS